MTALAQERIATVEMDRDPIPHLLKPGVKAAAKIFAGAIVVMDSSGFTKPGAAATGLVTLGRAEQTVDNTPGANGALLVEVRQGCFKWDIGGGADAIVQANTGQLCYVMDDHTVGLTAAGRSVAGIIAQVDTDGVWVLMGIAFAALFAQAANAQAGAFHTARGVVRGNVASLPAFTVASEDGITYAAGDRVLLVGQSTGSQNGLYVVGAVASGTAPLTRPADFASGETLPAESIVAVSEGVGTAGGAHSLWRLTTQGSALVVDTTSIAFAMAFPAQIGVFAARAVATANVALTTGLVAGQTVDGVTLAAGDRVLLTKQSTASQNGLYVATAAGTASLAPEWAQGQVGAGAVVRVGPEGTSWPNSEWKATATQASTGGLYTIGTTDPLFYPRTVTGTQALTSASPSTATVSNLFVLATTSGLALVDQTAASAIKGVLTAGRGTGSLALTGPNTVTDSVLYTITNW